MKDIYKISLILLLFLFVFFVVFIGPSIWIKYGEFEDLREITSSDKLQNRRVTEKNYNRADRGIIVLGDSIYLLKNYISCTLGNDTNASKLTLEAISKKNVC